MSIYFLFCLDQVSAVLILWYEREHMKTTSSDRLMKIMSNSRVCLDMTCNACKELIHRVEPDNAQDTEAASSGN